MEQRYGDAVGGPTRDTRDLAIGVRMGHDDQGRVVSRVMLEEAGVYRGEGEGVLQVGLRVGEGLTLGCDAADMST